MQEDIICHVCLNYNSGCPCHDKVDIFLQPIEGHAQFCRYFETIEDDCAPD